MKKLICLLLSTLFLFALVACDNTAGLNETDFSSYRANGVSVPLDAEAKPILEALGPYLQRDPTDSCYGNGPDVAYDYPSFRLQTYTVDGVEYLLSIHIYNDSDLSIAKTSEGLVLGAKKEDVLQMYGTPEIEDSFKLVYVNSTLKTKLQFSLSNGIVTKIEYLKSE